jgi:hypothetical protein
MKQNERKGGCERRRVTESRYVILRIPHPSFHLLLRLWALFEPDPPFAADQLTVLTTGDEFEIICWERIFGMVATPFCTAIDETFRHPVYGKMALEF